MATVNVNAYSYGTSTYGSHEFGEDSLPIVIYGASTGTGSSERIQHSGALSAGASGFAAIGGFTAAADAVVSATSTTTCNGLRIGQFPEGIITATSSVSITGNATFSSGGTVTVTVSSGVTAAGEKFILEETDAQGWGSYLYGVGVYDLSDLQTIISATSTVACSAEKINVGSASLTSTSTISANARRIGDTSALLNGVSTTTITTSGNGTRVRTSGATVSATASVTQTAVLVRTTPIAISALASLTCDGVFMVNGAATASPTATVAAICNRVRFGSGTPTANASITVLGFATRGGIASTGSTLSYDVLVQSVSGANKYFILGNQQMTLHLVEGNTYVFNYPSSHPVRFSTTSNGTHASGSEYTTGVTHNSSIQTTIVVATDAPTLYYYCAYHSAMGGTANTPSNLVVSTTTSDSERIQQPNVTVQPVSLFTATCNRVQSTSGIVSATSGTASIGREKWELIVNNNNTWTQIAA